MQLLRLQILRLLSRSRTAEYFLNQEDSGFSLDEILAEVDSALSSGAQTFPDHIGGDCFPEECFREHPQNTGSEFTDAPDDPDRRKSTFRRLHPICWAAIALGGSAYILFRVCRK